jgi:hypothetical protein
MASQVKRGSTKWVAGDIKINLIYLYKINYNQCVKKLIIVIN